MPEESRQAEHSSVTAKAVSHPQPQDRGQGSVRPNNPSQHQHDDNANAKVSVTSSSPPPPPHRAPVVMGYPPSLPPPASRNNNDGFFSFFNFASRGTNAEQNPRGESNHEYQQSYQPMTSSIAQVRPPQQHQPTMQPNQPFGVNDNPYASIPPGWATAVHPQDGQIYYYQVSTGISSWHHPNYRQDGFGGLSPTVSGTRGSLNQRNFNNNNNAPIDTTMPAMMMHADHNPRYAYSRPDNHQCSAVFALILCFPLGIFAMYHSWQTDVAWKAGRYGDAVSHARQAPQFASWGITIGAIYWILFFLFRRGNDEWKFPDFGNMFND